MEGAPKTPEEVENLETQRKNFENAAAEHARLRDTQRPLGDKILGRNETDSMDVIHNYAKEEGKEKHSEVEEGKE